MPVAALTWKISIGATFEDTITWRDSMGVLVPLPAGTLGEIKIRPQLGSATVLARFVTGTPAAGEGQMVLTDPGVISVSMSPARTALLTPTARAVFDIKLTFTDGRVVMKLDDGRGIVDIQRVVTRA